MAIKTIFEIGARDTTSGELNKAKKNFSNFEKAGKKAGDNVSDSFKRLIGPLLGAVSAVQGLRKLVEVTREFDVLNAGLITATGSAANAAIAFEAIQDFARETPYDLQQVTESFTKLKNYGLDPSERALTAYGNTASAMGKDLNQMIEAVADAATGEFERLKEFGIRSSKQGENVRFTFKGVETTVKGSSAEIQKYLIGLGENNFAGAMAQRMDTLDGAMSNLGDSWDQLFLNISQQGAGDFIADGVHLAIEAIDELNVMISSGQLEGYLSAIAMKFDNTFGGIGDGFGILLDMFDVEMQGITGSAFESVDFVGDAFENLPENVKAMLQILVVEFASNFDTLSSYATEFKESIAAIFTDDTIAEAAKRSADRIAIIDQARNGSIEYILAERDASINSYEEQIKKADEARVTFEELAKAKRGGEVDPVTGEKTGGKDRLAGFGEEDKVFVPEADPEVIAAQQRIAYLKNLKEAEVASNLQSEELAFLNKMAMLQERFESGEIPTIDFYNQLKEGVEQRHQDNINEINDKATDARIKLAEQEASGRMNAFKGMFSNLSSLMNSKSKKLFEIGKVGAISGAIVNTALGITEALKLGPFIGPPLAATQALAGMVQIQTIKSQQFGGGGTVSAGTSGGASPGVYQPPQPVIPQGPQGAGAQGTQIIFNGPVNGLDAKHIAETLKDYIDSTDFILVN